MLQFAGMDANPQSIFPDNFQTIARRTPDAAKLDAAPALILVVEDHDILREGLQILLENEGYRVQTAANGAEALALMDITTPDLILSDITMPEMDGYAFSAAVRARQAWVTIPFIFLTAYGDRETFFNSKLLGIDDYLVKPVDRQELVTTVRSRLERSQQLMLYQLERAYEASLIMLANAIELRDSYTRGHVERVMEYAIRVATQLGFSANQMRVLRFGAILHDIGKIYVPENILHKPSPLTSAEWGEMKLHTLWGAELLSTIPFLAGAIPIVRSHHERWDGTGYPDGLMGDQIPLVARIVAVVDGLDAMTTDRVYHAASTMPQAVQEIARGSGTRYDPRVVEAFLSIQNEL